MLRVLEITWMIIAIGSLITGVYYTFARSLSDSYVFLLIAVAAGIFFMLRRRQRVEADKES